MLEIDVRALRKKTIQQFQRHDYQHINHRCPQMVSFFRKLLGVGAPAEAKSHENQADLQLMMDNSVDVILRVGPDLLQRYVSPSSLQLFGLTPQEMIGLPAERFVLPEDHHVIAASVARLHGGETDVTARVRILRKDGAKVWVEAKPRLLRVPVTGKPGDIVLVIRDVTEQKNLEDRLGTHGWTDRVGKPPGLRRSLR